MHTACQKRVAGWVPGRYFQAHCDLLAEDVTPLYLCPAPRVTAIIHPSHTAAPFHPIQPLHILGLYYFPEGPTLVNVGYLTSCPS